MAADATHVPSGAIGPPWLAGGRDAHQVGMRLFMTVASGRQADARSTQGRITSGHSALVVAADRFRRRRRRRWAGFCRASGMSINRAHPPDMLLGRARDAPWPSALHLTTISCHLTTHAADYLDSPSSPFPTDLTSSCPPTRPSRGGGRGGVGTRPGASRRRWRRPRPSRAAQSRRGSGRARGRRVRRVRRRCGG
jgi:hypothetical protein